jgi:intein/homing endonuclease
MTNQFDVKNLDIKVQKLLHKARSNPLDFTETFLVSPNKTTEDGMFKANYAQRQIMAATVRNLWVCVSRRQGKCVVEDSYIIDPITKRPVKITKGSKFKTTWVFDFKLNKVVSAPCEFIESGVKLCSELSFGSGIKQGLSNDHLLFDSKRGWIPVDLINVGDRILAPTSYPEGLYEADAFEIVDTVYKTLNKKRIPDSVFDYNYSSLILFFRELFLKIGKNNNLNGKIVLKSESKEVLYDLQHLLLKLSIESRVSVKGLFIEDQIDIRVFLSEVLNLDVPVLEVRSPRRWEIVIDKKTIGLRTVYDLVVNHFDHNFISNNLVVHNSFSFTAIALWWAVCHEGKKILVFAGSSTQINAFFQVIDDWIACNPILQTLVANSGNTKDPQKRSFITGSTIEGFITGLGNSNPGKLRGLTADVCFPYNTRVLTDKGYLPIGDIVEFNLEVNVLTQDAYGDLVWKKINKRTKNKFQGPWVSFNLPHGDLECTNSHPFITQRGDIAADNLQKGDLLLYDTEISTKSGINSRTNSTCSRDYVRRWKLSVPLQEQQKCKTINETWARSKRLSTLEVRADERVVPHTTKTRREQGLRKNILGVPKCLSPRIHKSKRIILSEQNKSNYPRDIESIRLAVNSNLVWRRWIKEQRKSNNSYGRILSRRESINSSLFRKLSSRTCSCSEIQRKVFYKDRWISSIYFNTGNKSISSRIITLQTQYPNSRRKSLSLLQRNLYTKTYIKERESSLQELSKNSLCLVQEAVGERTKRIEKEEFVYNLEILDNHNYFAEGVLVHNCIVDEGQELSDEDWRVIIPIMKGDVSRTDKIRTYVAGTLNDPSGHYFNIVNNRNTPEFKKDSNSKVIFIPVDQNKDYTAEDIAKMKVGVPEHMWKTEYLLQVSAADTAVLTKEEIDGAFEYDWEPGPHRILKNKPRFLTVDWDKVQSGTNILICQYDPDTNEIEMLYQEEVPKSELTHYHDAVETIINLMSEYDVTYVIADKGSGEPQYEMLIRSAIQRTDVNHLADKIFKVALNEKINFPNYDPLSDDNDIKRLKPYLVGQLKLFLQSKKIKIPSSREKMNQQFYGFKIKSITDNTVKYHSTNEHIVDCFLFLMWGISTFYYNTIEGIKDPNSNADYVNTIAKTQEIYHNPSVLDSANSSYRDWASDGNEITFTPFRENFNSEYRIRSSF